jgi:hypothetical protein
LDLKSNRGFFDLKLKILIFSAFFIKGLKMRKIIIVLGALLSGSVFAHEYPPEIRKCFVPMELTKYKNAR